jgi:murein DD-endopeptidase MepM/ murein hydrolase activator NlpD
MSRYFYIVLGLCLWIAPYTAFAEVGLTLTDSTIVQGAISRINLPFSTEIDTVTGTFIGKNLPFIPSKQGGFYALLGVDMDTKPGTYPLVVEISRKNGAVRTIRRAVTVRDAKFPVQELTLEPAKVFPDSAATARIQKETKLRNGKWSRWAKEAYWGSSFIPPIDGKLKRFGHRRIINKTPRNPHSGVDISADKGTPVVCPANGKVILTGDFFFSGKSIYIDHGLGLIDMLFHLSRVDVSEGDMVVQGQVIGAVGSTGRSTGPHLHWGIRYRGLRINPSSLLELPLE